MPIAVILAALLVSACGESSTASLSSVPSHVAQANEMALAQSEKNAAIRRNSPEPEKPVTNNKPPPKTSPDKEAIFRRVVAAMMIIKRNLRDPDSVVWEDALANRTGDVICIKYRARNGFGGYTRDVLVVTKTNALETPTAWNKHCMNAMTDFTYAKYAL